MHARVCACRLCARQADRGAVSTEAKEGRWCGHKDCLAWRPKASEPPKVGLVGSGVRQRWSHFIFMLQPVPEKGPFQTQRTFWDGRCPLGEELWKGKRAAAATRNPQVLTGPGSQSKCTALTVMSSEHRSSGGVCVAEGPFSKETVIF